MLPGPADPVDNEMLREDYSSRPRNVSNADFDNRRLAQGSQANVAPQESVSMGTPDRIVDAQVHQPVPPVAVIVTPPKQERAMSPVVEIQPDLMYQVASTDNDVANTAMVMQYVILFTLHYTSFQQGILSTNNIHVHYGIDCDKRSDQNSILICINHIYIKIVAFHNF